MKTLALLCLEIVIVNSYVKPRQFHDMSYKVVGWLINTRDFERNFYPHIHFWILNTRLKRIYVLNHSIFIFFYPLQELLAIQQQGPRAIGFFGTRNMGFMHQELIEILSYALVITVPLSLTLVIGLVLILLWWWIEATNASSFGLT